MLFKLKECDKAMDIVKNHLLLTFRFISSNQASFNSLRNINVYASNRPFLALFNDVFY